MPGHFREYFIFSKKERIGIIALLLLIIIIWISPSFFTYNRDIDNEEASAFRQEVAAYKEAQAAAGTQNDDEHEYREDTITNKAGRQVSLFYFNPNTLPQKGWQQLGLPDRTIRIIQNYISKGGRFYEAEDLGKIFGLSKQDYNRLLPYVKIEKEINQVSEKEKSNPVNVNQQPRQKVYNLIDINVADTVAFIKLPGIGSKLAARIVKFRDKLGGFYTVEQIEEVYGIHDTVFQKIKTHLTCSGSGIQKLNINTASLDILKAHPYIKYQIANAVIQYRRQHGDFKSVHSLKDINLVTDEMFNKLLPYINVY